MAFLAGSAVVAVAGAGTPRVTPSYNGWWVEALQESDMSVSRRICVVVVSAAALGFSCPGALVAQTSTLEGSVLASPDGRPLSGVLVALEAGPRIKSDGEGAYRLEGVEPGQHLIAVVAPGCQVTFTVVDLLPGEVRSLTFEIAFDLRVFDQLAQRRGSGGRVVMAPEIAAMNASTLAEVLARVAPGMVGATPPQPGMVSSGRGRASVSAGGNLVPAVILDGAILGASGLQDVQDLRPSDVAWIEVLRGAAGGWEVGTGGSGGLIRVQTKRGRGSDTPLIEPERCEIPGFRASKVPGTS